LPNGDLGRWEEVTATLRPRRLVAPPVNRLLAASIDLAIIILPTVAVALIAAERFALIGPDGATARFSVVDQARLDELDGGFHRAIELGGSLFALDLTGLAMTMATMTVAALLAHVAFPAFGGGRSPGKAVTGLRVVAEDGGPVGVGQHLIRTVAGPIDLLGLGVPGLLGTLVAWRDVDRRRLGDRLAETRVSGRPAEWVVAAEHTVRGASADRWSTASSTSIQPQVATPNPTPAPVLPIGQRRSPAGLGASTITEVPVTILLTDTSQSDPMGDHREPDPVRPAPPLQPVRRLDGSPTRSPRSRRGAIRAEIEARTVAVESTPGAAWLGGDADYADWGPTTDVGAGAEPRRATGSNQTGPYDALLFPESSLADGSFAATITTSERARDDELLIEPFGAAEPMWDRERQAWVYRNRDDGRWFRHDETTGRWSRIDADADADADVDADVREGGSAGH